MDGLTQFYSMRTICFQRRGYTFETKIESTF